MLQAVALGAAVQAGIYEGQVRSGQLPCFSVSSNCSCCGCACPVVGASCALCSAGQLAGCGSFSTAAHPCHHTARCLQVSELMVMDVWQATLMRAFATKLAQEQGELGEGEEQWAGSSGSDDEGWEWPDEEAAAAAAEDDDAPAAAAGAP